MGIQKFLNKTKQYFSRAQTLVEPENQYAETSFEETQKRSLVSRALSGIGKFFGRLVYYTSVATIIPATISFYRTTPENPVWPFRQNNENAYIIKQYFDGTRGEVIGPNDTGIFNTLIERDAKHKDISNIVSAEVQEGGCEFNFRTLDSYEGKMKIQYLYQVKDAGGAKDWFWNYGKDKSKIDEIVRGALTSVLGKVKGLDVASGIIRDDNGNILKKKDGKPVNYMQIAEDEAKKILRDERVGVRVTNFARESVDFDAPSQAILSQAPAALEEARARKTKADVEVYETAQKAVATEITAEKYIQTARKYQEAGSDRKVGDIALYLADLDNNDEIAAKRGRIIKLASNAPFFNIEYTK